MADAWRAALEAVQQDSDFVPLNALIAERATAGLNDTIDWHGEFLTPLFVSVLLRLDDHIPALLALGADPAVRCLLGAWLCCPLHAAALRGNCATLAALLDAGCDAGAVAEASALEEPAGAEGGGLSKSDLARCNALHVLVAEDTFSEEVYALLMARGARLGEVARTRGGQEFSGLALPGLLGNKVATEERIDTVLGEEVRSILCEATRSAAALNAFLEAGAALRQQQPRRTSGYRFVGDVDFRLSAAPAARPGEDEEPGTALLYAAHCGSREGLRLLLYAGADASRSSRRAVPLGDDRALSLLATPLHLAVIRGDAEMAEQLLFFSGAQAAAACDGEVRAAGAEDVQELWAGLGLAHVAVASRQHRVVPTLQKMGCDLGAAALRSRLSGAGVSEASPPEPVTPLHMAVLLGDLECGSALLAAGAPVDEAARAEGLRSRVFCEMFGGEPVVGLEDWVAALLTGEAAVQRLLDCKTSVTRVLRWPQVESSYKSSYTKVHKMNQAGFAAMLEGHRLASPELASRLAQALEGPTVLSGVCPVHLACILEQPWALRMLADAGAPVAGAPPCWEQVAGAPAAGDGLAAVPLDAVFLSARVGGLRMTELLSQDSGYGLGVAQELPVAPDLTPHFFPRRGGGDEAYGDLAAAAPQPGAAAPRPVWAWQRLRPLELAVLHRRVDMAVLLARLGSDLLHTVDHVAISPPAHYSITEGCFRGLTPLHLCALMDAHPVAAALLNEAAAGKPVVPGVAAPPARQDLLTATCTMCWATAETGGDPEKEPWLWRDLTPLHLAILSKSHDVAELLVEASTSDSLAVPCAFKDVSADMERNFSPLLLAFERDFTRLHRKIARKSPTC